jgi:hypothetical protein
VGISQYVHFSIKYTSLIGAIISILMTLVKNSGISNIDWLMTGSLFSLVSGQNLFATCSAGAVV